MLTQLTKGEFKNTLVPPMVDVTATAEPSVDIWPYVEELKNIGVVQDIVLEKELVELVYRNGESTFDHILLPSESRNIFVIIVVDLMKSIIKGHIRLNLENEYEIGENSS